MKCKTLADGMFLGKGKNASSDHRKWDREVAISKPPGNYSSEMDDLPKPDKHRRAYQLLSHSTPPSSVFLLEISRGTLRT